MLGHPNETGAEKERHGRAVVEPEHLQQRQHEQQQQYQRPVVEPEHLQQRQHEQQQQQHQRPVVEPEHLQQQQRRFNQSLVHLASSHMVVVFFRLTTHDNFLKDLDIFHQYQNQTKEPD